jgi:hypothetical protein
MLMLLGDAEGEVGAVLSGAIKLRLMPFGKGTKKAGEDEN